MTLRYQDILTYLPPYHPLYAARGTRDELIRATCPVCKKEQSLAEALFSSEGEDSIYRCANGCRVLVSIWTNLDGDHHVSHDATVSIRLPQRPR